MSDNDKIRARALAGLKKGATELFAQHPRFRSMMLGVAQYWADEADDAVHYDLCASERDQPVWPHNCEGVLGEGCWNCGEGIAFPSTWDDNGSAVAAFEGYCHEAGSQEEATAHNYMPFAIARKVGDRVDVEVVGWMQRPENELSDEDQEAVIGSTWDDPRARELFELVVAAPADDGPRRVLADYLQEREDPRGEYIALSLEPSPTPEAIARRDALLAKHKRAWMHPLTKVAPASSARFARGFLQAVEVCAGNADLRAVREALAWGTVEKLVAHPTSECVLDPAMRALREVCSVPRAWIDRLAQTPSIEVLDVELEPGDVEAVTRLALPRLRSLVVRTDSDTVVAALPHAPWWSQLERLTVTSSDVDTWADRRRELGVPWLAAVALHLEPTTALGWELAFGPDGACEVTQRGFTPHASLEMLAQLLADVPADTTIRLVRSPYYVPSAADVEYLATLGVTQTITTS